MATKIIKGRNSFTQAEADEICRYLDTDRFKWGPEVNRRAASITTFLRKRYKFYITDFTTAKGFCRRDFSQLVDENKIQII